MLTLSSRHRSISRFSGESHSLEKGTGTEFSECRPYTENDDARNIDWRTSARLMKPSYKLYETSHELQICLIIDLTESLFFESHDGDISKSDHLSAILTGVLETCLVSKHGVSLILGNTYIPNGRGLRHIEQIRSTIEHTADELRQGNEGIPSGNKAFIPKQKCSTPADRRANTKQKEIFQEKTVKLNLVGYSREGLNLSLQNAFRHAEHHRIHDSLVLLFTDTYTHTGIESIRKLSALNDLLMIHINHVYEEFPENFSGKILLSNGVKSGTFNRLDIAQYRNQWQGFIHTLRNAVYSSGGSFWRTWSGEPDWEEKLNYFMRTRQ